LATAVTDAFQLIHGLEERLSIYREGSEMSQINKLDVNQPHKIQPDLFQLLCIADEIRRATNGAFDLTATALTRLWKSCRQARSLPDDASIFESLKVVGGQKIRLNAMDSTIELQGNGLTLDLGGIGKGFALDQLKNFLLMSNCQHFLIHGGQSSVIASGRRTAADGIGNSAWQVGITHPLTPGVRLATLFLNDQAIGTSGSGRQSFVKDGKRYGHIIDPRTGWPADHFLSVTVLADSATQADALATAIFVAGLEQIQSICDQFEISAVTVRQAENSRVEIETINLPAEQIEFTEGAD